MAFSVGNRLIAALDTPSRSDADGFVERLGGVPSWVKLGLELFCAEGPSIVRDYTARGLHVMLDLKLHDIPETVARATARVASLGAGLLTVHAGGGPAMLEAAVKAAGDMRILAVTVLTSMDEADLAAIGARAQSRTSCAGVPTWPSRQAATAWSHRRRKPPRCARACPRAS